MYIVADIGGTKTRIAGSTDIESFSEPIIFDTPQEYGAWRSAIVDAAKKCANGAPIERLCMGLAGTISKEHDQLLVSPHLKELVGFNIGQDLGRELNTKVHIENDTALCGLGEAVFGAGKNARIVVYFTVSTGVGGVRIKDKGIDMPEGSAEAGQQYIVSGEHLETLENTISGTAIQKRFGKKPYELPKDHPVWEELARDVAIGIHNSILFWTPDIVVLGGSMFNEIGIPVERVKVHLKEIMKALPQIPEIVHSELGNVGGLWGGVARLRQLQ